MGGLRLDGAAFALGGLEQHLPGGLFLGVSGRHDFFDFSLEYICDFIELQIFDFFHLRQPSFLYDRSLHQLHHPTFGVTRDQFFREFLNLAPRNRRGLIQSLSLTLLWVHNSIQRLRQEFQLGRIFHLLTQHDPQPINLMLLINKRLQMLLLRIQPPRHDNILSDPPIPHLLPQLFLLPHHFSNLQLQLPQHLRILFLPPGASQLGNLELDFLLGLVLVDARLEFALGDLDGGAMGFLVSAEDGFGAADVGRSAGTVGLDALF